MESMKDYWNRIIMYLKENNSELIATIQSGAEDKDILLLNSTFGKDLPKDFIDFYKIHNGQESYSLGLIDDEELLNTERILDEWNIWNNLLKGGSLDFPSNPNTGIKNNWFNPLWIPITYDGAGNHYCLDLDPSPEGIYGQVIRFWHDDSERTVEATSFGEWIDKFVIDLESNKVL